MQLPITRGMGILIVLTVAVLLAAPLFLQAKVGVGMGAGEIRLTDEIKPGGIYELPAVRIFNTGDEVTTYAMDVAYHQDHHELRPSASWFTFSPATFTLSPNESKEIAVSMLVPLKTEPGDYFAFVESGPVTNDGPGTSVGVAVATKLYFTVVPANIFEAIGYRVSSFFSTYSPWSWIGLGLAALVILILLARRFFSFNIAVRKS